MINWLSLFLANMMKSIWITIFLLDMCFSSFRWYCRSKSIWHTVHIIYTLLCITIFSNWVIVVIYCLKLHQLPVCLNISFWIFVLKSNHTKNLLFGVNAALLQNEPIYMKFIYSIYYLYFNLWGVTINV